MTFPFPPFVPNPLDPPDTVLPSYRYWRLNVTGNYTVDSVQFQELEFLRLDGSRAPMSGNGFVSSTFPFNDVNGWTTLFDNNASTAWISNYLVPQQAGYDYGSGNKENIRAVRITGAPGGFANRTPTAFDVQGSNDGSTWVTVWSVVESINWTSSEVRTFYRPLGPTEAKRRWRVYFTAGNGGSGGLSLTTVAFKYASGGSPTYNGTAYGSSYYTPGASAQYAFDGNSGTYWQTSSSSFPQWVAYDFGKGTDIGRVDLTIGGATLDQPKDFNVQYSTDGSTWTTAWSVTNSTGWSAGETRVFVKP